MKIPFKKFYYRWIKPIVIFSILMGVMDILYFLFEEIYKAFNFTSFSYYYKINGNKYTIWYMGILGPLRIFTSLLLLFWTKKQYMEAKYFFLLFLLMVSAIVLDLAYIFNKIYSLNKYAWNSSLVLAPFIQFAVVSLFTTLLDSSILLVYLFKLTGILQNFSYYTTYVITFYDEWILSTWFSLFLFAFVDISRFFILFIYGSAFNGTASFSAVFIAEYTNFSGKFWSVAISGPISFISGLICYFLSKNEKVNQVFLCFILCFFVQSVGFGFSLRGLIKAVYRDEEHKYEGNYNVSWALQDSLFTGTISALLLIILGLFYTYLKEQILSEHNLLDKVEFKNDALSEGSDYAVEISDFGSNLREMN